MIISHSLQLILAILTFLIDLKQSTLHIISVCIDGIGYATGIGNTHTCNTGIQCYGYGP